MLVELVMNGCLVTREENSIELEDYSIQWLTLLPKLHPKNLNKTENEEEASNSSLNVSNVCKFPLLHKTVRSKQGGVGEGTGEETGVGEGAVLGIRLREEQEDISRRSKIRSIISSKR